MRYRSRATGLPACADELDVASTQATRHQRSARLGLHRPSAHTSTVRHVRRAEDAELVAHDVRVQLQQVVAAHVVVDGLAMSTAHAAGLLQPLLGQAVHRPWSGADLLHDLRQPADQCCRASSASIRIRGEVGLASLHVADEAAQPHRGAFAEAELGTPTCPQGHAVPLRSNPRCRPALRRGSSCRPVCRPPAQVVVFNQPRCACQRSHRDRWCGAHRYPRRPRSPRCRPRPSSHRRHRASCSRSCPRRSRCWRG